MMTATMLVFPLVALLARGVLMASALLALVVLIRCGGQAIAAWRELAVARGAGVAPMVIRTWVRETGKTCAVAEAKPGDRLADDGAMGALRWAGAIHVAGRAPLPRSVSLVGWPGRSEPETRRAA